MSAGNPPPPPPGDSTPQSPDGPNLRARVPDAIGAGVFSTGVIVMTRPTEVVLDFVQTLARPQRVTARVVMPPVVLPQFIDALKKNIDLYTQRFGAPQSPVQRPGTPTTPTAPRQPSAQEIYDDLQIPDGVLSGAYANGVMIGHGATEFSFDFLTSFYPQSAVSARVFLAAGQVPRLLESLQGAANTMPPPAGGGQADGAPPSPDPSANQPPPNQSPPEEGPPGSLPPDDRPPNPPEPPTPPNGDASS